MFLKNIKITFFYFLIMILIMSCATTPVKKDNAKLHKKSIQFNKQKKYVKTDKKTNVLKEKYAKKKTFKTNNTAFSKSMNGFFKNIQKFTKVTFDKINKGFAVIYKYFEKQFKDFSKTKFYKMLTEKWG